MSLKGEGPFYFDNKFRKEAYDTPRIRQTGRTTLNMIQQEISITTQRIELQNFESEIFFRLLVVTFNPS